ncbi:MAG TPA: prolyl oligopeptidase family serine peptidase [Pseudoxanthomonas sp.]
MRGCIGRIGARWLLAVFALAFAAAAQAGMRKVAPGEIPVLQADEGLVLVAIDSDILIRSLRVLKDGKSFGAGVMSDIKAGRSFQLYVADAGVYEWREVRMVYFNLRYSLDDDTEFKFKVEPGKITYPGDLLFRASSLWRAEIAVSNRGLAAMDWLELMHPALYEKYAFQYSGHYPDPFPAFYREARAAHPSSKPSAQVALLPPLQPGPLPIAVKTLWQPERIQEAALNADGNLLAMHVRNAEKDWAIELIDLQAGTLSVLAKSAAEFSSMDWTGNDALLLETGEGKQARISVVRIGISAAGKREYVQIKLPNHGLVVDPVPDEGNRILFGTSGGSDGQLMVHKLDISSQKTVDAFRPKMRDRLNQGVQDDVGWLTDGSGRLRVALVRKDDEVVVVHGANGVYSEVMKLSGDREFDPKQLSFDGSLIYGLTDEKREQRELVEFDVSQRKISRTLFSKPGVDVKSVLFDAKRNPIGVTYYQGGRLVSEYFQAADNRLARILEQAFPDKTVTVVSRSHDGKQLALWVDAGDEPPKLYQLDTVKGEAALLDESMPWLSKEKFAPSKVVSFKGADGLPLEAFLTLPVGATKRPLIVFPHGGPIGIADRLHFDPEVQFLASLGYAVLRVNFRGSDGYGKAFREAGYGKHGTLIEDDIDAAVRHVLANYPLDKGRMCVIGGSYGGYSALVSVIRWPQRFRCAVSMYGVSDRILFFTASDGGRTAESRKLLEKVIGDPNTRQADMQKTSPLYQYDQIKVPVMLVHGMEDRRVDFEHMRRMLRMLDMAGNVPVGLELEKVGHGVEKPDDQEKVWNGVAGFLRKYLDAPVEAAQVP